MHQRIIGFDLARAYAIFGMFIVNFNFCFGSFMDNTAMGRFLNLFVGNSTAIFIILAGMGVSLMSNRSNYSELEKKKLKSIILKRSWFLVALGLLLFSWWPGDILHFYGAYMHIAAFFLFVPKKYYLWLGVFAIVGFHILLQIIPIDTSWNFDTFQYADFWTLQGFLRNTIYNGWNSIFPWLCYFMIGMFLGRLDWQKKSTKKNVFLIGLLLFTVFETVRFYTNHYVTDEYWTHYIMSEYFPAYIPFMMITIGFCPNRYSNLYGYWRKTTEQYNHKCIGKNGPNDPIILCHPYYHRDAYFFEIDRTVIYWLFNSTSSIQSTIYL
jgi:uncharacterized protein